MDILNIYYCENCKSCYDSSESINIHDRIFKNHTYYLFNKFIEKNEGNFYYSKEFFEGDDSNQNCINALALMITEEERAPKKASDFIRYLNFKDFNSDIINDIIRQNPPTPDRKNYNEKNKNIGLRERFENMKKKLESQQLSPEEFKSFNDYIDNRGIELNERKKKLDDKKSELNRNHKEIRENESLRKNQIEFEKKYKELEKEINEYKNINREFEYIKSHCIENK